MTPFGMYLAKMNKTWSRPQRAAGRTMKIIGALALILSLYPAYSQSIPPDRLPPAGYWNPGCIGTNGETYRQAGTFIPPVALWAFLAVSLIFVVVRNLPTFSFLAPNN